MIRKFISLLCAATMMILPMSVSAVESGVCGDNVSWTLDGGVLTVSGTGKMAGYNFIDGSPWKKSAVTSAVIEEGVTDVGAYAFYGQNGLETVTLSSTVSEIGIGAFQEIGDSFKEIYIPATVKRIGQYAFSLNDSLTIKGHPGTAAESHAQSYGIDFEIMEPELTDVTVSSAAEFEAAIKTQNRIILKDGVYIFDHPLEIGTAAESVDFMTITAENPGKAEILSSNGYEPVVEIYNSSYIRMEGLILGHESPEYHTGCGDYEYSSGYVLSVISSDNVTVTGCDLYGCGTVALYTSRADDLTAEGCVLRDCKESIATLYGDNMQIINCIITGNAYDESYATSKAAVLAVDDQPVFTGCTFANNYSTEFSGGLGEVVTTDCKFYNNVWDNGTPKEYGVCLNGITWQITDGVLRLGYPIELEGGTIESTAGEVLPYSIYSLPWRGMVYSSIDTAEGVTYNVPHGVCGDDLAWRIEGGTLTVSGNGDMYDIADGDSAEWYNYKDNLERVVIDSGVTAIGSNAFAGCGNIIGLTLGQDVKSIGAEAFSGTAITELYLPGSVETITGNPFKGCTELKEITIDPDNKAYKLIDGVLYTNDGTKAVMCPAAMETALHTVPSGVEVIGEGAFANSGIGEVVIPDTVTALESGAFDGFSGTRLVIPESVGTVGIAAFADGGNIYVYEDSAAEEYCNEQGYTGCVLIPSLDNAYAERDDNGELTVTLNTDSSLTEIVPVIAACDLNGVLAEIGELHDGRYTAAGADTIRLFIWDGLDTMRPFAKAKTVYAD